MPVTEMGCLGILTCRGVKGSPVAEPAFCSALCRAAPSYGLRVIIFTPDGVSDDGRTVSGFVRTGEEWRAATAEAPDIVYNRMFCRNPEERRNASRALHALARSLVWSRGLPDKWKVHQILRRSRRASSLLPETKRYAGRRSLERMLAEREDGVFLKPRAGTHGKRTLHAALWGTSSGGLFVRGRDGENREIVRGFDDRRDGLEWIDRFIGKQGFIMQPFLRLTGGGQPFDVRVLMQKDGGGGWTLAGMAARLGPCGSLTSNLHGGGTAVHPASFLRKQYGGAAEDILREVELSAAFLPPLLEAAFGRLGELGLDFGIDPGGRIWLLEANSKPGRSAFTLTGDRDAARRSAENPLSYARYLLLTRRRSPRSAESLRGLSGRLISMVPKEDS
ncbi:YheC/YheD family protein [Paenibacillus rhizophilus]|uniref:YheC/YheD family protein n=1 Tax=Paenibacillus rhizophilus TaxID=1850366 RepID=A0A3N9Q518_9BACL|nr:YheC/YheD family protein [Paenibacillus rhizophilus]RQW12616.1 YheC/YheD family protein [Paenibacillus rhizophilus]